MWLLIFPSEKKIYIKNKSLAEGEVFGKPDIPVAAATLLVAQAVCPSDSECGVWSQAASGQVPTQPTPSCEICYLTSSQVRPA